MNIYIDFDDCLCETGRVFSALASKMFGIDVPYEKMRYFDLQKSFSLTDEQFRDMMTEGHRPEVLLSFEETPGACAAVNDWLGRGYDVCVITGRPYSAYEASREWLDRHGLGKVKMYYLNKYGRDSFTENCAFSLEIEDYTKMHFDCAVEDSPSAFRFFSHLPELKVLVFDRPWNRECVFPKGNYLRCRDWNMIRELV